jgi:hypothetical protein
MCGSRGDVSSCGPVPVGATARILAMARVTVPGVLLAGALLVAGALLAGVVGVLVRVGRVMAGRLVVSVIVAVMGSRLGIMSGRGWGS